MAHNIVEEDIESVGVGRPDYTGREFFIDELQQVNYLGWYDDDGEDKPKRLRVDQYGRLKLSAEIPDIDIGSVNLRDLPGGAEITPLFIDNYDEDGDTQGTGIFVEKSVGDKGLASMNIYGVDENGDIRNLNVDTEGHILSNIRQLTSEDVIGQVDQIDKLGYRSDGTTPQHMQLNSDGKVFIKSIEDQIDATVEDVQDILEISAMDLDSDKRLGVRFETDNLGLFKSSDFSEVRDITRIGGTTQTGADWTPLFQHLNEDLSTLLSELESINTEVGSVDTDFDEKLSTLLSELESINTEVGSVDADFDEKLSTLLDELESIEDRLTDLESSSGEDKLDLVGSDDDYRDAKGSAITINRRLDPHRKLALFADNIGDSSYTIDVKAGPKNKVTIVDELTVDAGDAEMVDIDSVAYGIHGWETVFTSEGDDESAWIYLVAV